MTTETTYPWLDELRITWQEQSKKMTSRREFESLCASHIRKMWTLPDGEDRKDQAYTRVTLFASESSSDVDTYLTLKKTAERRAFAKKLCPQSHVFNNW
jgi:hypothetical protein